MIFILILCVLAFVIRLIYVFYEIHKRNKISSNKTTNSVKTVIVIGSGGHTTEMLRLVQNLNNENYNPRIYIMASSDTTSEVKIHKLEGCFKSNNKQYEIVKIPRSRAVNQSYSSSVLTTLFSTLKSVPIMLKNRPELILCNGPGTCIPICLIGFFMRLFWISHTRIIFVESICRVKSLSLSGKILFWFADVIVVQWPQLKALYKRTCYFGRL